MERDEVLKAAEQRVEKLTLGYYADPDRSNILLAALENDEWWEDVLGISKASNPEAISLAREFLRLTNVQPSRTPGSQDQYGATWDLGVVRKSTLVALLTAVIGASVGIAGAELHPILVSVAGAEAAVGLNVLSSLLLDKQDREQKIDGLDLAVISVLRRGHYSPSEIVRRISESIDVNEIKFSLQKLFGQGIVAAGDWPETFTLTSKGSELRL